MRRMFSEKQIKELAGISVYKHSLSITGFTGSVMLWTTSEEKFTLGSDILNCVNYANFKNGIFLHGTVNGPSSYPGIIGAGYGDLVCIGYSGTALSRVTITPSSAVTDTVSKVL